MLLKMVMGRMVRNFTERAKVFAISAWHFTERLCGVGCRVRLSAFWDDFPTDIEQSIRGPSLRSSDDTIKSRHHEGRSLERYATVTVYRRQYSRACTDLHIYMGGVGAQQFFILAFLAYAIGFHRAVIRGTLLDRSSRSRALTMLYSLYVCLALITVCTCWQHQRKGSTLTTTDADHFSAH